MTNLHEETRAMVPEILDLLRELAAIDTGTGYVEGILAAGTILRRSLEEAGLDVEIVPAGEYGQHLVARRPGRGRGLLLLGHLDTVRPPGSARLPALDGDSLAGPGVYDCKGGISLAVALCRLWSRRGWPPCPVTLIVNADEEVGSPSSRPLIEAAAGEARAVLVVEPAPAIETVITARRGIGRYVLRVFGRAAHAGSDREAGINAAVELSAKILALARADARAKGYAITVGTIAGGVRPNIVPEYAQAEIDLRLAEPGRIAAAEAALRKAAAVSRVSGARYSLEGGLTRPPMPETPGNRWLFALAAEEARDLGLELQPFSSGGGSDGNFCAAIGTPVLDGLGPAGAGAHAEHEHILVSSLAPRLSLLHALGRRLGESGGPVGQGEGSA